MIALKNEEEDEQNDKRRRFEESDAEKALVHQHNALPPGMICRRDDSKLLRTLILDST
jgi:hypothetical protein